MARKKSSADDAADIMPPPQDHQDRAARAHMGLRMPPIIDVAPGVLGRFGAALQSWLKNAAYQSVLLALLAMALGLMVLTLFEVGNVSPPDWRALWPRPASVAPSIETSVPTQTPQEAPLPSPAPISAPISAQTADIIASAPDAPTGPASLPDTDAPALDAALPPSLEPPVNGRAPQATANAPDPLVEDLRQTLADTRRQLAEANSALLTAKTTPQDNASLAHLSKKAMLADLLLRLDYGLAFDDVIDSGQLDTVLSARELAVLALFAETGVPTEAALRAQADILPELAATAPTEAATLPAMLNWLVETAPDVVQVTRNPMAAAPPELTALHGAILARDYKTGGRLARLMLLEQDLSPLPAPLIAALQTLYADMRAFEETRAVLAALRNDYLAGVRP